jgi:hypothetical protein
MKPELKHQPWHGRQRGQDFATDIAAVCERQLSDRIIALYLKVISAFFRVWLTSLLNIAKHPT